MLIYIYKIQVSVSLDLNRIVQQFLKNGKFAATWCDDLRFQSYTIILANRSLSSEK